jgi:hypothetical protein
MPATRMATALAIGDQLRQAREDLAAFDAAIRLRRIEADPARRTELLDLVTDLEDLLDRAVRFRKDKP